MRVEDRFPGFEQHFGLEHEAIADNADIAAFTQHLAQPPEEFGSVERQFLHLRGQGLIQALAEIDDLHVLFFVQGFRRFQGLFRATICARS